jgi:acetyltransferase-like isoleucine patch superfamily enzyme
MRDIDDRKLIRKKLAAVAQSPIRAYKDLTVGEASLGYFVLYEFLTCMLGPLPGGIGFFLRKQFYPKLFQRVGKGLIIGRNVVIRHPWKIALGNNVTIDDNCLLDGRGAEEFGIMLDDDVIINRNCMLVAKEGMIRIGNSTSIGSNSVVVSLAGVDVGESVLTAAGCYISAGAYHFEKSTKPVMNQGTYSKGPIVIGANCWLGTGVIVLDDVSIGCGAVIGAGAVVVKDILNYGVAVGVPAKTVRYRNRSHE